VTRYSITYEKGVTPDCTVCSGLGIFYDPHVQVGRYGTLKLCRCVKEACRCDGRQPFQYWDEDSQRRWCTCRPARMRLIETQRHYKEAVLPERFRWKFHADFLTQTPKGTPVPKAQELQGLIGTLREAESEINKGFFFHGPPGTGKTLVSCIMLNELILHQGRPGRFLNLSRMYQKLRDTFSEESRNYGQTWPIFEEYCNVPFLVIDDFGIQRGTEWEMEMLYDLVDARYSAERFTVVTTNQGLDQVKELSQGRIYSRLAEMCWMVEMQGEDFRQHTQNMI
jgi:DNA replication protein DnaC